jgi:hypothetical protein
LLYRDPMSITSQNLTVPNLKLIYTALTQ